MSRPPPDPFFEVPDDEPVPDEEGPGTPWRDDVLPAGAPDPELPAEADGSAWQPSPWPDPGDPEPVNDAGGTDRLDSGAPLHDLPWNTTCIEVATGRTWRAVLDPTRDASVVFGKSEGGTTLFWLGALTVKVHLALPDAEPRVVFGRDALAGRVRVLV